MIEVRIGKCGEILNERPSGMSYEEYRAKRIEQAKRLRGYNVVIMEGNKPITKHVMGRLEGILMPSWTRSEDYKIIIE